MCQYLAPHKGPNETPKQKKRRIKRWREYLGEWVDSGHLNDEMAEALLQCIKAGLPVTADVEFYNRSNGLTQTKERITFAVSRSYY